MAEILSGGLNWGSTQQAIVTMDKEGHPLTCCNPVTGECLGGGGSSDFIRVLQTVNVPKSTLTGTLTNDIYVALIELENANENLANIPEFSDEDNYRIWAKGEIYKPDSEAAVTTVDGVDVGVVYDSESGKIALRGMSDIAFTIEAPADIVNFYIANPDFPWSEYFPSGKISKSK